MRHRLWAALLACGALSGETAILQIQVAQGEGAVFAAGARAVRPLGVLITDETGAPVDGAAVSFRLPEEGVSGAFANGLHTDVVMTGPDGRAVAPPIHWGALTGPCSLRVTAAKDQAKAGVLVAVFVSDRTGAGEPVSRGAAAAQRKERAPKVARGRSRAWIWLMPLVAGVGSGAALALSRQSGGGGAVAGGSAATAATGGSALQIGAPAITIGRP